MPKPKKGTTKPIDVEGLSDGEIIQKFLDAFGANGKNSVLFEDVMGNFIPISNVLFLERNNNSKLRKNNRHKYLHHLIDTIKAPDEIYLTMYKAGKSSYELRKRYLRMLHQAGGIAVFEYSNKSWHGTTVFPSMQDALPEGYNSVEEYIKEQRRGVRVYKRNDTPET